MIDAQTILKMIEAVDPADTAKLFEIDKAVALYLYPECSEMISCAIRHEVARFCTSRDALKSIRPEGWKHWAFFDGYNEGAKFRGEMFPPDMTRESVIIQTGWLPTEELAELHTIIQAIDHDRSQK